LKKKHLKKLHTYGSWEVFFFAAPTAQNSPELHFRFINSFIQLSLLRSLIVHEHKNVIALDKVDCKLSCRGTTDEIDEKCHTGLSDKGVKRASYIFALKKQNLILLQKTLSAVLLTVSL
jgi:hypothetical protein